MHFIPMLAVASTSSRALGIVLLCGLAALTITLGVLMWTRWGQARPLSKCAGLSVVAHLLLLVFAYGTSVFHAAPGNPESEVMHVRIVHTGDSEDASPWQDDNAKPLDFTEMPSEETLAADGGDDDNNDGTSKTSNAPPLLDVPEPEEEAPAETETAEVASPPDLESLLDEAGAIEEPSEPIAETIDPLASAGADAPEAGVVDVPPPALTAENAASSVPGAAPYAAPAQAAPQFVANNNREPGQTPRRAGDGEALPPIYAARVASDRLRIAEQFGGSATTEAAVDAALEWLARNQAADGRWDADAHGAGREIRLLGHDRGGAGKRADTGITGLALLALLGAGNTHFEGAYRENVQHGLEFLLSQQSAAGDLCGDAELFAAMYCHGIATLALSEAYAMTGDARLKEGVQRAIAYTLHAQHATGGWRYRPGDTGDMSQFGWQLMALKSAELGGTPTPTETRQRVTRFLRSVTSGRQRGLASYRPGDQPSRTMSAEAMVCRELMGIDNGEPAMAEGAQYVAEELPGRGATNFYYWYYGTLALHQRQGREWTAWNASLQHELIGAQRRDGEAAGSWNPDTNWGSYGGRVYSTSLGALCLEVYYRYLPIYLPADAPQQRWAETPNYPVVPR